MSLLSRKADYALLILGFLHHKTGSSNAREISEKYGLSRSFVANILKELCQKGYVVSHRGVKGGYALLRASKDVTLAELLESVEEGFKLTVCTSHGHSDGTSELELCSVEHVCPMKGPIAEIHRRLMVVLTGVTLHELFAPGEMRSQLYEQLTVLNIGRHAIPMVAPTSA